MPRTVTPQQRFADWLAQLREAAGSPSYTRLVARNARSASAAHRGKLSRAGLSSLLNGGFVLPPRLVVVEAFVDACLACVREDHGTVPPEVARHLGRELWRGRHSWLVEALDPVAGRPPAEPARAAVEQRERTVRDAAGDRPFRESAHHDRYGTTRSAFENYHSEVLDREEELAALLDALHAPGAYHVIEGPAFAGKTAFMVELYRRLAARGCPTLVFYVVDRYAHRSQHFLDAVIGQLLAALRSDEAVAAPEDRPGQFTRLWADFAALGTAGRPAVLLVDGLDEQEGTDGISPLLPVWLSGHAHVVVATRSLPDFRTAVPRHHALAAPPSSVVPLTASPHAKAWRDDAKRHLEGWLSSADPDRERIATALRVAAAPLTRHDLADLLGVGVGRIAGHLHAIERCLLPLPVKAAGVGYQWAHVTYGRFVDDWVGRARAAEEIQHIRAWARRHAEQSWPESTPPFLLHGLHHFLRAHADAVGGRPLVDLVTADRRRRLFETYGHDGVFLESIALAREELDRSAGDPTADLEARFRLDVNELTVMSRAHLLPRGLLRLLVLSGLGDQAEGVALAVENAHRAEALAELSEAFVDAGDAPRAAEIVDQAWPAARLPDDPYWQLSALLSCARAARKAGAPLPEQPLDRYADTDDVRVLCAVAAYRAEAGDVEPAWATLDRLLAPGPGGEPPDLYSWVWAEAAATQVVLGEVDSAVGLARTALTPDWGGPATSCGPRVGRVVGALVRAGRVEEATALADSVAPKHGSLWAILQTSLIDALYAADLPERAAATVARGLVAAATVAHPAESLLCSARLRAAQARGGYSDGGALDRLWEDTRTVEHPGRELSECLVEVGDWLLTAGRRDDAAQVARQVLALNGRLSHPFHGESLHDLASAMIEAGDLSGAHRLALENPYHRDRAELLRAVRIAEAEQGVPGPLGEYAQWPPKDRARLAVALAGVEGAARTASDLARGLVADAEAAGPEGRGTLRAAAVLAVEALLRTEQVAGCAALLSRIGLPELRAETLAALSRLCRPEDAGTADRLLARAVTEAGRIGSGKARVAALCAVLHAAGPVLASTPGVPEALAALHHATRAPGTGRAEWCAKAALALHAAELPEQAADFAGAAYAGAWRDADEDDYGAFVVCEALTRTGLHDSALLVAEELGYCLLFADIARSSAAAGDPGTALRAAERALEAWREEESYEAYTAEVLIDAVLPVRTDLALSVLREYEQRSADSATVVGALVRGLVSQGHAAEALDLTRELRLQSWRAQALVSWSAAPVWPVAVRRRTLGLLSEHALRP